MTALRNPALSSGSSTAPVEMKADRLFRRVCAASSALIPKNLVCQWIRSFGLLLRRKWTSVARRQVFEKLDPRARRGPQRSNAQAGAENVVEALLLGTVVLALT